MSLGDLVLGHRRPVSRGAGQGAVADAVQPVLRLRDLGFSRGGAQNFQVAVDLRAIGVDDDALDLLSKREGQ